jgi:hypothetical protein
MSKYFQQLDYFTSDFVKSLNTELHNMIDNGIIDWHEHHKQICINTHKDHAQDKFSGIPKCHIGTGSLVYNWADNGVNINQEDRTSVEMHKEQLSEYDFNTLSPEFNGTVFEELFNTLSTNHKLGRLRFMKMTQRKCLSWHQDYTTRLHIVLDSYEGNFMLIEDEVKHMPNYTTWKTDTTYKHTAFNASMHPRVHIVGVILDGVQRRNT